MQREDERTTGADEAERLRADARARLRALREFWVTFLLTGVILIALIAVAIRGGLSWFVSNAQAVGTGVETSFVGQPDFALATVGRKEQGVYDALFGLTGQAAMEEHGGVDYYIASARSSIRVDSDRNLNNYLANADLRPGNRGSFDIYVIRRSAVRDAVLRPVFSAWHEDGNNPGVYADAFAATGELRAAAEFLQGHILLFAGMDEKGMYSGNIDFTRDIAVHFGDDGAQAVQGEVSFNWGAVAYADEDVTIYRLPVHWVWPEQFGNFIYTGNSYNKNLFASGEGADYLRFKAALEDVDVNGRFFCFDVEEPECPKIDTITEPDDYVTATRNYEKYSGWYDAADEQIGTWISYIELGFEIARD
ncbi:MAG: hypothetical protein ACI4XW_00690 [Candidatus Spyradocola sp.]